MSGILAGINMALALAEKAPLELPFDTMTGGAFPLYQR